MSVSGLRVLRGPDWRGGDTDGGEGHVGTVLELLGNQRVRVLWDMGQEGTCDAGHDGKCEVRVLDTAQIGVRHPETECSGCGESDIWGMLWRCQDCTGCDLCPLCYGDDTHDLRHQFLRIDTPGTLGQPVPKRKTSVKHRSLGLFPGSKVTRGKDWQWGDQDGGQGSEGKVKGYENVLPDSSRSFLSVEWPSGDVNSYRVGFYGNVDLKCVEEEVGPCYYRDHLPVLDTDNITQLCLAMDKAPSERDSTTTTARRDVETEPGSQHAPCVQTLPDSDSPERQESGSIPDTDGDSMAAPESQLPAIGSQQEGVASLKASPEASPRGEPNGAEDIMVTTTSEQEHSDSPKGGQHNDEDFTVLSGSQKGMAACSDERNVVDLTVPSGSEHRLTADIKGRQQDAESLVVPNDSVQGRLAEPKGRQQNVTLPAASEQGRTARLEGEPHGISHQQHTTGDITTADGDVLTPGARVAVRVCLEKCLQLQQQCGADTEGVNRVLGETGHVTGRPANDSRSVTVKFPGCEIFINANALVKVEEFQTGDKVRLRPGVDEVKVLNCRVGWRDGMEQTVGRVGRVVTVDSEGDLLVSFGRHHFLFSPACCTHVTSGTPLDSLKLDVARMKTPEPDKSGVRMNTLGNDKSNDGNGARMKTPEINQSGARMKSPEVDQSDARMKPPGPERSGARMKTLEHERSGARVDINDSAGENKALFKTLGDSMSSDRSGHLPHSFSLFSDFQPGRLLNAVQRGDHLTVREMCANNWEMVEYELQDVTPLILAANRGHRQVVRVLLEFGADVNHSLSSKRSPMRAAFGGDGGEDIILMLLEGGADPFVLDEKRHTYLHHAAWQNMPRVVKALAERGVDINAKDDLSDTAMHLAINKYSHDAFDVLLSLPGIDLYVRNASHLPMLHQACLRGNIRAAELILDRDLSQANLAARAFTPLHAAAYEDHDDCVRLLVLKGGADVNRWVGRYPPLQLACVRGMYRAAEALLELGADINVRIDNGKTALHLAVSGRKNEDDFGPQSDQELEVRVSLACLLVSNGAVLDARDWRGRGPLSDGHPAIIEGVQAFLNNNPNLVKRQGGGV